MGQRVFVAGLVAFVLGPRGASAEEPCARFNRDALFKAGDGATLRLRTLSGKPSAKLTYRSAACVERSLRCAVVERGLDCLDDGQRPELVCLHLWATKGECRADALARHLGEGTDAPGVKQTLSSFRQLLARQTPEAQAQTRAHYLATASPALELRRASKGRCDVTLTEVSGSARGAPKTFAQVANGEPAASMSGLAGYACPLEDVRPVDSLGAPGGRGTPHPSPPSEPSLPLEPQPVDP